MSPLEKNQRALKNEFTKTRAEALRKKSSNLLPECGRQKIWKAIRVLRHFTLTEMITVTGESEANVADYIKRLKQSGNLVKSKKAYILAKDPGPQRPAFLDSKAGKDVD